MTPTCSHRSKKVLGNERTWCRHPKITGTAVKSWPISLAQCESCPYSDNPPDDTTPPKISGVDQIPQNEYLQHKAMLGGVGTELILINSKSGVKSCQECYVTAIRMNELGPMGCRHKIDSLIEEILPRAKKWSRKRVFGWLVPDHLMQGEIRKRILQAIETVEARPPNTTNPSVIGIE